jgi:hypothetical protein
MFLYGSDQVDVVLKVIRRGEEVEKSPKRIAAGGFRTPASRLGEMKTWVTKDLTCPASTIQLPGPGRALGQCEPDFVGKSGTTGRELPDSSAYLNT